MSVVAPVAALLASLEMQHAETARTIADLRRVLIDASLAETSIPVPIAFAVKATKRSERTIKRWCQHPKHGGFGGPCEVTGRWYVDLAGLDAFMRRTRRIGAD